MAVPRWKDQARPPMTYRQTNAVDAVHYAICPPHARQSMYAERLLAQLVQNTATRRCLKLHLGPAPRQLLLNSASLFSNRSKGEHRDLRIRECPNVEASTRRHTCTHHITQLSQGSGRQLVPSVRPLCGYRHGNYPTSREKYRKTQGHAACRHL